MTTLMQTLAAVGTVLATSAFAHAAVHSAREFRAAPTCVAIAGGSAHILIWDSPFPRFPRRWPRPPSEAGTE
ncbi:hypothetical protein OIU34_08270 [Pararhizobium sp. BT-229]|uniref:hypothetical protein n=1 Tax=Pararhizobium sp. BT-229 TaxID=2986923 RepID=UPI0021F77880|nr:hypothetical protein [Pararhizobium sp. BT-229]MCV9961895.1 hypothetical protein [Pararhizobium sp. BT-229]